jgi:hypothetical protein
MRLSHLALAALLCLGGAGIAAAQGAPDAKDSSAAVQDGGAAAPEDDVTVPDDDTGAETGSDDAGQGGAPLPVKKGAPFAELPGRWVGDGRLGLKDGKTETVKCRATYFVNPSGDELKQNIRCASASGKIEVKSTVNAKDGKLSGTWNELVYNLGGEMTGEVTEKGFRIAVRAGDLTANMDVIVMNDRQIVEIQFFNSTLRGLTLVLTKG